MWLHGGRGEVHTGFWWGSLKEGDDLEALEYGSEPLNSIKCGEFFFF